MASVLLFFVIVGIAKGSIRNYQVEKEIEVMKDEIVSIEAQNEEFAQLIHYLKSDEFIEQEAKLKLGLKHEGEGVVVIPSSTTEAHAEGVAADTDESNPMKWWRYFFQ